MVRLHFRLPSLALACGLLLGALPAIAHEHPAATPMARNWQERLAAAKGSAVSVAADEQGRLWSVDMRQGHLWLSRSTDGGKTFADIGKVNAQPEAILADGQNRPQIAVHGQVVVVSWSQALPKLYSGHVRMARSEDGGLSFTPPVIVNENREEIGHGFNAMKMDRQGNLALAWLDGRERSAAARKGVKYAGSSVYYATSSDFGKTWTANGKLADNSCECCRIGLAIGPDGGAVAQWRHLFAGGVRDFATAPLKPGAPVLRASEDGWEISACPHHGGDLSIDAGGRRHYVWFTGSTRKPGLFYRYAEGAQFSTPRAFGDLDAQAGHPTVFADGKQVAVVWREFDGRHYRLRRMHSSDRGETWSAPSTVAEAEGATDLPLFVQGAAQPLVAWGTAAGVRIIDLREVP